MAITAKCLEATFSLTGEDEAERIKGVGRFKYLGKMLDQSDDDWKSVLHNIRKARQVWGRLGKLLRREWAELTVPEKFYLTVVQAVLLFGAETWVLTEIMIQRLEGAHVIFLRKITRKQATRRRYGYWRQVTSEAVLQGAGTQTIRTYVDRRQATVAEWVATRHILYVCVQETGYEVGGRLRVPWWRKKSEECQLRVMVEAILAAARVRW